MTRRLIAWLIARSRVGRLAFWIAVYAICSVAEFVVKSAKDHSGERVKKLWQGEDDEEVEPV